MKVALVQDWLNGMRGGEKVLEELCLLYPDADVPTLFYEPDRISETINRMNVMPSVLQRLPGTRSNYRYLLPLYPWAIRRFDMTNYDLVISSSHCAAKGVRVPVGIPHICYCHSPIRYIWDQYEEYFGGKNRWKLSGLTMPLFLNYLRRWDVESGRRVDLFIANSRNVAAKIKKLYDHEAVVINPPVDTEKFKIYKDGPDDYYLIISALVPYKRVDLAVQVFNRLKHRLIIAGRGPEARRLRQMAEPNIEIHDWISDEDLVNLYGRCRAFIMPGEEDFGITPLEAMASGRPVIALRRGGALETVVEGKTGLFFDEATGKSLQNAIESFDPAAYDPNEIRAHAETFGRERFRRQIKQTIDEFLQTHSGRQSA